MELEVPGWLRITVIHSFFLSSFLPLLLLLQLRSAGTRRLLTRPKRASTTTAGHSLSIREVVATVIMPYCYTNALGDTICEDSGWRRWGRWVLVGIALACLMALAAAFVVFSYVQLCSCPCVPCDADRPGQMYLLAPPRKGGTSTGVWDWMGGAAAVSSQGSASGGEGEEG